MIKATTIEIQRAEGRNDQDFGRYSYTTWDDANFALKEIARTVDGYIDKVDFTVEFEDGYRYDGRYEAKNSGGFESLETHIRTHLATHIGLSKPEGMSEEDYQRLVDTYAQACPEVIAEMQRIATTYRIG